MHVFVSLPFDEAFDPVFETISKVVMLRGLEAIRAEPFYSPTTPSTVATVERDIRDSRFIIADLTSSAPNVLQEVRHASEVGKARIFVSQEPTDRANFNTQGLHIHPYDPDDLDDLYILLLNVIMDPTWAEAIRFNETPFHGIISIKVGSTNTVPGRWQNPFAD